MGKRENKSPRGILWLKTIKTEQRENTAAAAATKADLGKQLFFSAAGMMMLHGTSKKRTVKSSWRIENENISSLQHHSPPPSKIFPFPSRAANSNKIISSAALLALFPIFLLCTAETMNGVPRVFSRYSNSWTANIRQKWGPSILCTFHTDQFCSK